MVNKDWSAFVIGEKVGRAVGHAIKGFLGIGLKYLKKLKKVNK